MHIPFSVGQKLLLIASLVATVAAAIPTFRKAPPPLLPPSNRSIDVPPVSYVKLKTPSTWVAPTIHTPDYSTDPAHRIAQYLRILQGFESERRSIDHHADDLLQKTILAQEQSGMGREHMSKTPLTDRAIAKASRTPLTDREIVKVSQQETNLFILNAYPGMVTWFHNGPTSPEECRVLARYYEVALRKKARVFTAHIRGEGAAVGKDSGDAELAQASAELRRLYRVYPELYRLNGTPFSLE